MYKRIFVNEFTYGIYLIIIIVSYPLLIVLSFAWSLGKCLWTWQRADKSVKGEVALITGSGRGLGRFIAIELAKKGCHLAIVDIQGKLAQDTAEFISRTYDVKVKAYKVDVTDYQQLLYLRTQVTKDLGNVTILINNAGIIAMSSHEDPPPEDIQRMINVNLAAMIYTIQIFLPVMKKLNRGHIVNISSMTSVLPSSLYIVYGATKAAVRNMTSGLRIDLMQKNYNISATTMLPTFLTTNKRISTIVNLVKANRLGPSVDGDVMAHYVVKAMLNKNDEVSVPHVLLVLYKLLEIFPAFIKEHIIYILTIPMANKMCDSGVTTAYKTPDIDVDM